MGEEGSPAGIAIPSTPGSQEGPDGKRIQALFQKAIASNSVREKNLYLNELSKLFKKHAADYSEAVSEAERLDEQIATMRQMLTDLNQQYEKLKESTAFLNELEFYQAAPDVPSLKALIRSIERDILAISPLADRNLLDQTNDYVDLLDLRETRLRQLVEAFNMRIAAAEKRLECASTVIDEFGSITNLLDRVRQLRQENERLAVRQLRFSRESLLRPRRLTKCDGSSLRAYLVALQNELAIARKEVAEAQESAEAGLATLPDESEFALELLSSSLCFSNPLPPECRERAELDSAAITAIVDGVVGAEPAEVRLMQVDAEYAAMRERTARLRQELTLRRSAERVGQETGKARVEKLHALNERLLAEIHSLRGQAEAAEQAKDMLTEMLAEVTRERVEMQAKGQALADQYRALADKHAALCADFRRTWKAAAGLFRLTELFGKAYLAQVLEPSDFVTQVAAFTPIAGPRDKPFFTEQPPPVLMKFFEDIHAELQRRRALAVIAKGEGRKLEELRQAVSGLSVDENLREVADVVERAPRAVLEQLGERGKVREVFDELLVGIRNATQHDVDAFGEFMTEKFGVLREVGERILCKVKRAVSTQTYQARKNDIETQYLKSEIQKLAKAAAAKR